MRMPAAYPDRDVCVVGLGFVGLTLAVAMADSGFRVQGVEVREDILAKLRQMQPHFFEPRLADKLARVVKQGSFTAASHIDPDAGSKVYIITVGTPLAETGRVELMFIERASREVAAVLRDGDLVILRSTVKLGTARNVVKPILEATGREFELAVCPERTLEGQALLELHTLPQIIGSDDPQTALRCCQLFGMLTPTTVKVSSLEAAELVKLVDNTYRDVSFAFSNEVAKLCSRAGVSAREIIAAGRLGYSRTNLAVPGPVGGPCLEKDPHILVQAAAELGVELEITKAARRMNEQQPSDVAGLIAARAGGNKSFRARPRIALLGLAFKGVPATDDLRGTMALPILRALQSRFDSAEFIGFDPVVPMSTANAFFGIPIAESIDEAVSGADLVVIANNHPDFRSMDLAAIARRMNRPSFVYDFWNLFDDAADAMPLGVSYLALGSESLDVHYGRRAMREKRYLVTGGAGFIGSALVRRLIEEGHSVRVLDNGTRGDAGRLADLRARVDFVSCDVRDSAAVIEAAAGCDAILHLAALNGTKNFYARPDLVLEIGVKGMFSVLEAVRAHGIEELVLVSSSEAYQTPPVIPTPEDVPLTVGDPWNPRYSYAGSKIISEIMLGSFHRDCLKRAIIVRPHNVYGPDMGFDHVLPQFVMRAAAAVASQPAGPIAFPIQGNGSQTRAFVHISDFVDGLITVLARGAHREIYNIGSEEEVTICDLARIVFAYFGRDFELRAGPVPAGSTPRRCPSVAKLRALGFQPKISLQQGISELADWYLGHRNLWPRPSDAAAA